MNTYSRGAHDVTSHQRARDVTNRGGLGGGHSPPASHVPPSPPEALGGADFISAGTGQER